MRYENIRLCNVNVPTTNQPTWPISVRTEEQITETWPLRFVPAIMMAAAGTGPGLGRSIMQFYGLFRKQKIT